ncbi:ABC transporter substrate-binding protein [Williamsia phyllosphaerae]|uniref:Glycine/betaine ABC transporter substrate-binding protein n=1 Tax=Williamsia phyllosphaerae TaxID=885042 RepID=A0ABQ1V2H4_9NOCA|nr:ABC transporter substrate-binding protein [Williamsia phyllosphaerae]GGF33482.1 glycine/betaine ABC transporter substrate-binding protein [Williamsia phyllosphaerae]
MKKTTLVAAAVAAASVLTISACGGDPLNSSTDQSGSSGSQIIIGSADFTESQLVGEIYAQALQSKGVAVKTQFNIGSREVYFTALKDSSIDLVPEYTGALLKYLDEKSTAATPQAVTDELTQKLPEGIVGLTPSPAEDKDAICVTQDTASKYKLAKVSDLAPVGGELALGAAPEFKTRVQGVVGLKDVYGVTFKSFVPLDAGGTLTMNALTSGQVQAANLFTTDPGIAKNNLVTLTDDKSLFAAQNVLPVIKKSKQTDTVTTTLNAVSAKLTTDDLLTLNGQAADGTKPADIAKQWLAAHPV